MTSEKRVCQNCKQEFTIEPEDFVFYEKIGVPPPTWCPMCRVQRRLAIRNERFLFKRESDFSGKEIFAMFPASAPIKVFEKDAWYSDKWNPMDYGMEVDFSEPFLSQLLELYHKVPIYALSTTYEVNSEYANNFTGYKNCYLLFNGNYAEDCLYGTGVSFSKNSVDNSFLDHGENCYGNFWLNGCSNAFFSAQCTNCYNIFFCKNCVGCHDCFGCMNLRNKSYYFFNKPYDKEEYKKLMEQYNLGSSKVVSDLERKCSAFWLGLPVKYMEGLKNTNCSGDYIFNCKNVRNSYIIMNAENVRYGSYMEMGPIKDCYDYTEWGNNAELLYESADCGLGVSNLKFCMECWSDVRDAEYSLFCQSSSNLFGCVGVRKKKYCILNKEYSEKDYQELREKIVQHMKNMPYETSGLKYAYGEFFPPAFSSIPYNQTPAYEHFPLKKDEAITKGYFWEEREEKGYAATIKGADIPDDVKDTKDGILKEIILCESWEENVEKARAKNCTKVFRLHPAELLFHRRYTLALPRRCPNCREFERLKQRNSVKIFKRECMCGSGSAYKNTAQHFHGAGKCPNEFETSYAPDRPEIVYCENCYNSEVA